jgi:hypothetical protein
VEGREMEREEESRNVAEKGIREMKERREKLSREENIEEIKGSEAE